MELALRILAFAVGFVLVALASKEIGHYFTRIRLPLISGFLFTGILAGPYVLGLIPAEAPESLQWIDRVSLAVIAFAAGSELYIQELRSRLKSIAWITLAQVVATFALCTVTISLLSGHIAFLGSLPPVARIAVGLIAGAILVARSPSSAMAVVSELRAKGPFTQTALGVIVIADVIVIILYAAASSTAGVLIKSVGFSPRFALILIGELLLAALMGWVLSRIFRFVLARRTHRYVKRFAVLALGYSVFALSHALREYSHHHMPFDLFVEPLLVCMIASFLITNFSNYRAEFTVLLNAISPGIFIVFFTLTGATLELDALPRMWVIMVALFVARLVALFVGSLAGGMVAGDPMRYNRIGWMAHVTQAGIGLGLAKEVAIEFPEWGGAFATMITAVIILSQLVGPPFIKWAILLAGEAHPRGESHHGEGPHSALIIGLEGPSYNLARQLDAHGWQVVIASRKLTYMDELDDCEILIFPVREISLEALRQLDIESADAIVTCVSDEESYEICQMVDEHFGDKNMVVRLNDPANQEKFRDLGAHIVEPATAVVSAMEHFVRSPMAAGILMGLQKEQTMADVQVRNPELHGAAIRDLRLPLDVIVLSVHRHGNTWVSHGFTQLEIGDWVTVSGSEESIEKVVLQFEE